MGRFVSLEASLLGLQGAPSMSSHGLFSVCRHPGTSSSLIKTPDILDEAFTLMTSHRALVFLIYKFWRHNSVHNMILFDALVTHMTG